MPGNPNALDTKAAANGALASLGGGGNAWEANSIWSGGLTNGFTKNTPQDKSRPRDAFQVPSKTHGGEIEGKTGSGSLVGSSVSEEELAYRASWGSRRSITSAHMGSQPRYSDASANQPRSISNAGLPPTLPGASQTLTPYASRPSAINLNPASVSARPSFSSQLSSGLTGQLIEDPPNVFTKFERPVEPLQRKPDSAIGSWTDSATTPSPTEERRPQLLVPYGRTASIPASRDGSIPPSYRATEPSVFTRPDYSRSAKQPDLNTSRPSSISSTRTGPFSVPSNGADQIAPQFGQLNLSGGNSRPGTSYKPPVINGHSASVSGASRTATFPRPHTQRSLNGIELADDMEEMDRSSLDRLGLNDQGPASPSNGFLGYGSSTFGERFPHAAMTADFRPGQSVANNSLPSRSHELPNGQRPAGDWQAYGNGAHPANRRFPAASDQQQFLDPRVQQMMALQLRGSYATMYSPFPLPNTLQFHPASPYMGLLPLGVPGMEHQPGAREDACTDSVQSSLMYEFKSNPKTKRYELRDIYDHIAEFSGDQYGSRFIQTKLETANSDEKERVFREIEPNTIQLATDVFGNYVIQKLFEHGDQAHKKILANKMKGHVLYLSTQTYGCRVVQKALEHVLVDQQASLVRELDDHVIQCVKDCNGNHVIQKAIERCPASTIGFIIAAFRGQVQHLSIHTYGCRVIQRCFEKADLPSKDMIMAELRDGIQGMVSDQYGNYVVQHIVSHDQGEGRRRVLAIVAQNLESYSKHKFASNVVEKCLEKADDAWRQQVVRTLVLNNQNRVEGEGVLVGLIKDSYGNYVIQKLLDTLSPKDYCYFVDVLQPAMTQVKRTGPGKQVVAIDKKMHRFPAFRTGGSGAIYNAAPPPSAATAAVPLPTAAPLPSAAPQYQLSMPTPPFGSNFTSAATTPPPLTSDTQSLQSSGLPSVNGDAIEGATLSSKVGETLHDGLAR